MIHSIDGATLKLLAMAAANAVEREKQNINDLNVFPVPDGDTGTNMSLTLNAAGPAIAKLGEDADATTVADALAAALLRGARGNSGVITSLLCRGLARGIKGKSIVDGADLAEAMVCSADTAYNAVLKPAEGTILTVARKAAEKAVSAAAENGDFEYVLECAIAEAERVLPDTMNQNPVLKKAGVVDAGAMGYIIILKAAMAALRGEVLVEAIPTASQPRDKADFSAISDEEINFTYCTEFIVEKENDLSTGPLSEFLASMGDSLVLVEDDEIIKVHVHTNDPGKVIHEAMDYGSFSMIKVENMRLQHTGKIESPAEEEKKEPVFEKDLGFVAVCSGEGLSTAFSEIGVDSVISGGQTMNPSTEDILKAIEATPARTVCVLPNNKNIILSAQQCIGIADREVRVIPTRSVAEGISAMIAVTPGCSADEAESAMNEIIAHVRTFEVTYAAKDADFDGCAIKKGDYLALDRARPFGTDPDLDKLMNTIADAACEECGEFITIYYGCDVCEEEAEHICRLFTEKLPDAEVNLMYGGQPVYYYMISVE